MKEWVCGMPRGVEEVGGGLRGGGSVNEREGGLGR